VQYVLRYSVGWMNGDEGFESHEGRRDRHLFFEYRTVAVHWQKINSRSHQRRDGMVRARDYTNQVGC
jgi:hypothetical protein